MFEYEKRLPGRLRTRSGSDAGHDGGTSTATDGRLGRRPDDLEDLVQETLLALHLKRATWDPSQPVSG